MTKAAVTKNYVVKGGEEWVVGGKLTILPGATISGLDGCDCQPYELPTAGAETLGGVKVGAGLSIDDGVLSVDGITPAAEVAALENNAELADVITAFNSLVSALKTAGLMSTT